MGANKILNILMPEKILLLAEGLTVFKAPVPASLAGKTVAEGQIRRKTGCNVVAINSGGISNINPDPTVYMNMNDELVLISTTESEKRFLNNLS
jgi:K+/H+ antiporter YhaU regulatory subunit KhtT